MKGLLLIVACDKKILDEYWKNIRKILDVSKLCHAIREILHCINIFSEMSLQVL